MPYIYLSIAILAEVIGTTALKAAEGFTRPLPSLIVIIGYAASFYFLSLVLQWIPMSITYAIWAGMGIVLITLAGIIVYRQVPDLPAIIGMGLIVSGVLVIHLYSTSAAH